MAISDVVRAGEFKVERTFFMRGNKPELPITVRCIGSLKSCKLVENRSTEQGEMR